MYAWLRRWASPWVAGLLLTLWYAVLLRLVLRYWFVPSAEFRYGLL